MIILVNVYSIQLVVYENGPYIVWVSDTVNTYVYTCACYQWLRCVTIIIIMTMMLVMSNMICPMI